MGCEQDSCLLKQLLITVMTTQRDIPKRNVILLRIMLLKYKGCCPVDGNRLLREDNLYTPSTGKSRSPKLYSNIITTKKPNYRQFWWPWQSPTTLANHSRYQSSTMHSCCALGYRSRVDKGQFKGKFWKSPCPTACSSHLAFSVKDDWTQHRVQATQENTNLTSIPSEKLVLPRCSLTSEFTHLYT